MTLTLIRNEKGELLLEGREPGEELEYYDLDGEGGKATKISFTPWNQETAPVEGVETAEYTNDDTFWSALEIILTSARAAGVELPDYAA